MLCNYAGQPAPVPMGMHSYIYWEVPRFILRSCGGGSVLAVFLDLVTVCVRGVVVCGGCVAT